MNPNLDDLLQQRESVLLQMKTIDRLRRGTLSKQFFKARPAGTPARAAPIMFCRAFFMARNSPSACRRTKPPKSSARWTITAASRRWPKRSSP